MKKKMSLVLLLAVLTAVLLAEPVTAGVGTAIDDNGDLPSYYGDGGDVVVPDGVKSIDDYAFEDCTGLTSISIPKSVTRIGKYAFRDCVNMTSINMAYGMAKFDVGAFEGCSGLTSIDIPKSVTSIGNDVFAYCRNLTSIDIPYGVTSLGDSAFRYCSSLKSVRIPASVTIIDYSAFYHCDSLTSVVIPDSVTSIGYYAFENCGNLTSIVIPASVTSFGKDVFKYCSNLTAYVNKGSAAHTYCVNNNVPYKFLGDGNKISGAVFASAATVGKPVSITVKTSKDAKYVRMCAENGAAVKTWSTGYTDSGDVRTWKLSYTFSGAGNRSLTFKASVDNLTYDTGVTAKVTVNKAVEAVRIDSAKFNSSATVGKAVGITMTTPATVKYIAMCDSTGKTVYKTWTSGYTDSGTTRTWKVSYSFAGAGNRTMYFKASADNSAWSSLVSASVTVNKAVEAAKINSVKFDSSATVGKAVGITVTTPVTVKYIAMCDSTGKTVYKTWTSGYTDSGTTRTWKVSYSFAGAGNRTMYFKASADNSAWSTLVSAAVTVSKAAADPKVNSAVFNSDAVVGKNVGITVKTTTATKYVRMCAENGGIVKTWSSGYTDSGDVRTWKLTYSFSGTGYRSITFKASADNNKYDTGIVAKVAVNPAVPVVSAASFNASSAKVNQNVGITVKTSSNATTLALCAENGAAVKTWSANGNSTVSGNVRTWNVSYAFSGAGTRSISFKSSADGSTYGSSVIAKITITK